MRISVQRDVQAKERIMGAFTSTDGGGGSRSSGGAENTVGRTSTAQLDFAL